MPDDSIANAPNTSPQADDLEKLIADAEQQASQQVQQATTPEQSSSTPTQAIVECDHAGSDIGSRRWCRGCKKLICQFCWSVLDSNYCSSCMQKVDIKVVDNPVVDDDGVAHNGRRLIPEGFQTIRWIPEGKTTAKALSEMNSTELSEYIEAYKQAVHDAERALDFRRIRLGSAQLELDERKAQDHRRLRADKTKYPVKTVSIDAKTGKQTKSVASTEKLMEMMKMLEALAKLKAKPKASGGEK